MTNEELVARFQSGDESALVALLDKNEPALIKFAGKFAKHDAAFDDAMQECRMALWEAAQKFDCSLGLKFSTFFWRRLGWSVQHQSLAEDAIRTPHCAISRGVERASALSLDWGDERDFASTLSDGSDRPDDIVAERDERERDRRIFNHRLEDRDRLIVLKHLEGKNHREIGEELGVTRERVRQIFDRAIERISKARDPMLRRRILNEFSKGLRTGQVAARLGVARETVRRHLKDAGVEWDWTKRHAWHGNNRLPREKHDQIVALLNQGKSIRQIAKTVGVSKGAVESRAEPKAAPQKALIVGPSGCDWCGAPVGKKEFYRSKPRTAHKYCSGVCYQAARRERREQATATQSKGAA